MRVHLFDRSGDPVPIGVFGELYIYIGGVALARGYRRRAGLSAERFMPDAFAAAPGERLYRTGDLARRLGDGHILFLGRRDHQVKLRGFRIEMGEVEAALREHPTVRAAVAEVRTLGPDLEGLVGYVVLSAEPSAGEHDVIYGQSYDEYLRRWAELAPSGLRVHRVPGGYFSVLKPPHLDELIRVLGEHMRVGMPA